MKLAVSRPAPAAARILSRRDLRRLFGQLFEWDGDLERIS